MKILFVAPRLPVPADTGAKIRTLNIIKQLKTKCDVDLACFSFDSSDKTHKVDLENLGINVHLVPLSDPGLIQKAAKVLFHPLPFSAVKYYQESMVSLLNELKNKQNYDAIHIDHIHMAHYKSCFNGTPCFVDEHNVEYKILERCANVENNLLKKFVYRGQAVKMKDFEAESLDQVTGCFAVSEEDQSILKDITQKDVPVDVIANGVDTDYFSASNATKASEKALVFTGSMDWLPNDDAIVHFGREIAPIMWEEDKDIKVYVVGKNPSKAVLNLGQDDERIIVTGRVDDVRPYIEKAQVFIVPIRVGGGTRLKILEALSMQKAVVSTSIGAEGITYTNHKDIVIADEPETFASEIVKLLNDPQKCKSLGKRGRDLVLNTYDWRIVGKKLNKIYKETTNGRKA